MDRCRAKQMGCTALDKLRLHSLDKQRSLAKRTKACMAGHIGVHQLRKEQEHPTASVLASHQPVRLLASMEQKVEVPSLVVDQQQA